MPALSSAREAARRTSCAANMKSIWLASNLYSHDFDDRYPRAKDCIDLHKPDTQPSQVDIRNVPVLPDALMAYTKSKQIFKCPSDVGVQVVESLFPEPIALQHSAFERCGNSYEYRTALGLAQVITTTALQEPSAVNMFADLAGHWHGTGGAALPTDNMNDFQDKAWQYRYNVIFADGHLKLVTHAGLEGAWRKS